MLFNIHKNHFFVELWNVRISSMLRKIKSKTLCTPKLSFFDKRFDETKATYTFTYFSHDIEVFFSLSEPVSVPYGLT